MIWWLYLRKSWRLPYRQCANCTHHKRVHTLCFPVGQFWSGLTAHSADWQPQQVRQLTKKRRIYLFNKLSDPKFTWSVGWNFWSSHISAGRFFSRINLPRKQEALKEACIHPAPKGVGETSSRPTLVTKKGDSIHPTWTKYNLKMAKSGWFGQCHSSIFTCHEFIFIIFVAQKSCKDIHRGCFSGNGGLQDLLDDPEGSQGFCLLNNVAIGAAYASGYPCGFPENEGWNKDKIPPCHDKRFFCNFCALTLDFAKS